MDNVVALIIKGSSLIGLISCKYAVGGGGACALMMVRKLGVKSDVL